MTISAKSDCPTCGIAVTCEYVTRNGGVYMRKTCPVHGVFETPFAKDATFFEQAHRVSHGDLWPESGIDLDDAVAARLLTTFAVDVTTRCNLTCPTCVSNADSPHGEDPPIEDVLSWIPDFSHRKMRFKPNISLIGGESTLREDLPDIIRAIIVKGLVPRMNSNGVRLRNDALVDRLWDAGLRWIILQFDGFSEDASIEFRGKDYIRTKFEVIDKLSAKGFFLHLAVMVQKGVNDGEAYEILRYATSQPNIRRVSFYPRSRIGRVESAVGFTDVTDVADALDRAGGGAITRADLLDAKRIGRWAYRLTGHPMFNQRPCIFPFLLLRRGDRLIPVSRLFKPLWALRHIGALLSLLRTLPALLNPDSGRYSRDLLFVNIEKFYDKEAFDLVHARNCHHVYLTGEGPVPFCVYNVFKRRNGLPVSNNEEQSAQTVKFLLKSQQNAIA